MQPITSFDLATLVPHGSEGLRLPARYAVEIDDPKGPLLLEIHVAVIEGQPRCVELRCRPRSGGPPVSSESLRRVPLARYVRESVALCSFRVEIHPSTWVVYPTGRGDGQLLGRASKQHPRRQMTDDLLREVARVYSEAESKPTLAVMNWFQLSRPTAGRWVMEARKRGFLAKLPSKRGASSE
jgi:hypothetical protein